MKLVTVHTDGGCEGNPGVGGWAAVLRYESRSREISGGEPATTNNRMELRAAIEALKALKEPCQVDLFTDSQYLRKGITEWIPLWRARKWRTTLRKPVKNEDLWRELDDMSSRHKVRWHWVKGHAGHGDNERCDALANREILKVKKQHTPDQLARLRAEFLTNRSRVSGQENLL